MTELLITAQKPEPENLRITRSEIFQKKYLPTEKVAQKAGDLSRVLSQFQTGMNSALIEVNKLLDEEPHSPDAAFARLLIEKSHDITIIDGIRNKEGGGKITWKKQEPASIALEAASKEILDWFKSQQTGLYYVLSSFSPKDKQRELDHQLSISIARAITVSHSLGKHASETVKNAQIAKLGNFLIQNTDYFSVLKNITLTDDPAHQIMELKTSALASLEALSLKPEVGILALREWVSKNSKEARKGLRIYQTPYYENIMEAIRLKGRKKNGIGSVILYGPPGTGKTELLQEKNRLDGYKTRVINIHHYSNYEELIGGRTIQLGMERGGVTAQKIKVVLEELEQEDPSNFERYMTDLFSTLQAEGKVHETIQDFLSSFVSSDTQEYLQKDLSVLDWNAIKKGFIDHQKARLLRTSLPNEYQESLEDIVKGEILLAIRNHEKVVLDEVDKAGPNSLGGLLSILAKSPGQTITIGEATIEIPSWFSIDATSNSVIVNEFFLDRFQDVEVDTPPAKDQLMIAGVRLCDEGGNMLLSNFEQEQLVGFFLYVLPEINKVLQSHELFPVSNRRILELSSYLVDFTNSQRTDISIEDAIKNIVSGNILWRSNQEVFNGIQNILKRYKSIFAPSDKTIQKTERLSKSKLLEQSLKNIVDSPLYKAMYGLSSEKIQIKSPRLAEVEIPTDELGLIKEYMNRKADQEGKRTDIMQLPIGISLQIVNEGHAIRLTTIDEQIHELCRQNLQNKGRIVSSSEDGKVCALGLTARENERLIMLLKLFDITAQQPPTIEGEDVRILGGGRYAAILNHKNHIISLYNLFDNSHQNLEQVSRFDSTDGLILVEDSKENKTKILLIDTLNPIKTISGTGFKFAHNLLVQQLQTGDISSQAYFIV